MIPAEALGQKEDIAESSEKHPVSEDPQASSLDRKTLEELKRSDMLMNERMDKQDTKIDAITNMLTQQQETKSMLEALFTRLPPPYYKFPCCFYNLFICNIFTRCELIIASVFKYKCIFQLGLFVLFDN